MTDTRPDEGEGVAVDLLVVGAGMAGLTAAAYAARHGAEVLLVEKAAAIGGTAALSGAYVWTLASLDDFDRLDPGGRLDLQRTILDELPVAIDQARALNVPVTGPVPVLDGVGHRVDLASYLERCRTTVEAHGGHVVVGATVDELVVGPDGRVGGARVTDASGSFTIASPWTLLATGGFAANARLLGEWLGGAAAAMPVRAAGTSTGDGLALALAAGGSVTGPNRGFYGHLVPAGTDLPDKERLRDLSMYHSEHSLLLGHDGCRYTDESAGDHYNAAATLWRSGGRALLVWDGRIHREVVLQPFPVGSAGEDRLANALAVGGAGARADDLAGLATFADVHGFPGEAVVAAVEEFNATVASPEGPAVRRATRRRPLAEPPYYAVVVQPAVTATYGGIRVDDRARALTSSGEPLGGLLVAGIDTGDAFRWGYGGGLALAAATAIRAVRTAGIDTRSIDG